MRPAHLIPMVDVVDPRRILPPEEGALILVLGGTAVLAISLVFALARGGSRLQRPSQPTPSVGPRPKRPTAEPANPPARPRSRLARQKVLLKSAARAGVGTPQLVTDTPGPNALILVDCLNCRSAEEGSCEWKRESLEKALRQFDPAGRVDRVSCQPRGPRACIFEIQTGEVGS